MNSKMQPQQLTPSQAAALEAARTGHNVFITGAGGSGKSITIRAIYQALRNNRYVALTSTTGLSAQVIGGTTLHSFLHIFTGEKKAEEYIASIKNNNKWIRTWLLVKTLIIDEISMLSAELFDKLEYMARILRSNEAPFGGIQLILCGDFLQIKPVNSDLFCFQASSWNRCVRRYVILREILRQNNNEFIVALNKFRFGILDNESMAMIESRQIPYENELIKPTRLCSLNDDADKTNKKYYDALTTPEKTFEIKYKWEYNTSQKDKYLSAVKFPKTIKLKVGTQVMHTVNNPPLVNGSRGIVVRFERNVPIVKFRELECPVGPFKINVENKQGKVVLSYSQIPLKLSWAISIHKSQGMTLDLVELDCKKIFEFGQLYVALSRCSNITNLYIKNLDWSTLKAHPAALKFYANLEKIN